MTKVITILLVAATAVGCSGGPGAPLLRTDANDGQGPLIPNCENVSALDKTKNYIVGSYLTTWGSASREGTAKGLMNALPNNMTAALLADGMLPSSEMFCKKVPGTVHDAFRVVTQLMPKLGYKITYANANEGVLETDFLFQKQPRINQWKDRYIITFEEAAGNEAIVKAFRDVYISRCSKERGCSGYIRATSVGHNEAWILNFTESQLGQNRR